LTTIDFHALAPVEILAATILIVLVVDLFLPARAKAASMWVSMVGVLAALGSVLSLVGQGVRVAFGGAYVVDAFTLIFQAFFLLAAVVVLLISYRYLRDGGFYQGEYYFLLLTAFLGCALMPASRNLLMLFLALELVSAPGFLLSAFRKSDIRGNEGGLKFFIIGVLSTAVMLFGMSLIYGLTGGQLELHAIAEGLAGLGGPEQTLADLAILFVVVGFAFKVSAVPFQFWAPDTYEGAPVPVAAFLAVMSSAAGFAGLLQLMFIGFAGRWEFWAPIFAVLSLLTMFLGNLVALRQTHVVRLLAYSGIAQAGYVLLPFALVSNDVDVNRMAFAATVTYILIYAVMNLGAFAVAAVVAERRPSLQIEDFAGLMKAAPLLAVAMTAFMVSLAGVPPTGGFYGKLNIFLAAIDRGGVGVWLAIAMVINSVISVGYYLLIPRAMIFEEPLEGEVRSRIPVLLGTVTAITLVLILAIFVNPNPIYRLGELSSLAFGS
jgi:NADH-quinone oxidoreductase subunit N